VPALVTHICGHGTSWALVSSLPGEARVSAQFSVAKQLHVCCIGTGKRAREGKNVQRLLPHLSTYLGHVSIEETATYLRMTAELLSEANARFESYSLGEGHHA